MENNNNNNNNNNNQSPLDTDFEGQGTYILIDYQLSKYYTLTYFSQSPSQSAPTILVYQVGLIFL